MLGEKLCGMSQKIREFTDPQICKYGGPKGMDRDK